MKEYNNISASSILIEKNQGVSAINSLEICNTHAANAAVVGVYYTDGTDSFYKIKSVTIPVGATLVLEDVAFDNEVYSLMIELGSSQTIDVIIN
tara:strand:- start:218 stop:499 length:282 start_codon:yes stop_codon:yes gene_type:complete